MGYDETSEYLEQWLHSYFSLKRVKGKGEWFDLSINDVVAIDSLFWTVEGWDIVGGAYEFISDNFTISDLPHNIQLPTPPRLR